MPRIYLQTMLPLLFFFLGFSVPGTRCEATTKPPSSSPTPPNFVIFMADDLGHGDLGGAGGSGHPTSVTPNLDKLAQGSKVFNNFYVASPVCSPSRAALLTGRYPVSVGIWPGVFWPGSVGGLSPAHPTLASELASLGYETGHVGKWHLGATADYLPSGRGLNGFQHYYGVPYSHDMCPCPVCFPNNEACLSQCRDDMVGCPLFRDRRIVEQPTDLTELTDKYTKEAIRFIGRNVRKERPYLLYMAYHQTHHPQFAARFRNSTLRGGFGDALAEMDHSVGAIMSALTKYKQLDNTLVIFTSDNGPSLLRHQLGGCSGIFRCGKGTTYEGGMRVPGMFHWRSRIRAGVVDRKNIVTTLDIMPTLVAMAKNYTGRLEKDTEVLHTDGHDISRLLLTEEEEAIRESFLYYPDNPVENIGPYALRYKNYKAHFYTRGSALSDNANPDHACRASAHFRKHDPPLLFDLDLDPGERYDLSNETHLQPLLLEMQQLKRQLESRVEWADSEIRKGLSRSAVPCCHADPATCQPFPQCCDCRTKEE